MKDEQDVLSIKKNTKPNSTQRELAEELGLV